MRAVLLDAMGTLVALEPPAPRLVAALRRRGVRITEAEAAAAMRAEVAHYRAHHASARDAPSLDALRDDCTRVLRDALPDPGAAPPDLRAALLESLVFTPYPEVPAALRALRRRGVRLVVCSNWDVSLHDVLAGCGLRLLLDGVVTSAQAGAAKPDPAIFAAALDLAGVPAADAVHAGDDPDADVAGARASGIEPVLVARDGRAGPPGVRTLRGLDGLLTAAA